MNIKDICEIVNKLDEVEIKGQDGDFVIVEFEGVPVSIALTDEAIPRIRFSVDVQRLDVVDEDILDAVMFSLLDLNTEIDPVSTAIDSSDPENIIIQARTSLRVIDLQDEEVVGELRGLVFSLPMIKQAIEDSVLEVA